MARHAAGDQVICQIRDRRIVSMYDSAIDDRLTFEIIAIYDEGYFVCVPSTIYLKDTIVVNESNYKKLNMLKRFIGCEVYYITDFKVYDVYKKTDGMCCSHCGDFFYMAEANQSDGTLICFLCRQDPWR
jgi:hypothetical protein